MSNTPNNLDEDFPGMAGRIHDLKVSDNHFARLVEEYYEINRDIHRVETRVEPTSEDVEEEMKRRLEPKQIQPLKPTEVRPVVAKVLERSLG